MRVAILGAGGWGKNHVRVFCELLGVRNVIVCEPDVSRREAAREAHPDISLFEEPVFEGVDAVVIATPAVTHYALAREALCQGKHVLVEKPMALTSRQAEELVVLAEETERILMVDHLLEYHPAVQELKRLITKGHFGKVLHLSSQRLNLGVIRTEENALWSLASHDVSIMLYLLDEEPEEVFAAGQAFLQPGVEDVACLVLRFASGVLGHIHVSWLDPVKTRKLTVVGEGRMAVYDDMAEEKLVLFDHRVEHTKSGFHTAIGKSQSVTIGSVEPLRSMAEVFLQSVKTGAAPPSDGRDGLRVVRVLEQAQQSIEQGKGLTVEGT